MGEAEPRAEASHRCTPRSVEQYALFYARHVYQAQVPEICPAEPSWPWWEAWTPTERSTFFQALARHSRLRPDLIARDVGTKSLGDVCTALRRFDRYAARVQRYDQRRYGARRHVARRRRLERLPAAHTMSHAWIDWEEQHAHALAQQTTWRMPQVPLSTPVYVNEQLYHVAQYLYATRPRTLADDVPSETVSDLVARLVEVGTNDAEATSGIAMTADYLAWAHHSPVPPLRTRDDVARVMNQLVAWKYLHALDGTSSTFDVHDWPWTALRLQWTRDPRCAGIAPHLDILDIDAIQDYAHTSLHVTAPVYEILSKCLYAWLLRVMYELTIVAERAKLKHPMDKHTVWTTVARLGYVYPEYHTTEEPPSEEIASQDNTDGAPPTVHGWNADMLHAIADVATHCDAPVAWTQSIPQNVPGLATTSSLRVPDDWDASSSDSDSESVSSSPSTEMASSASALSDTSYATDTLVDDDTPYEHIDPNDVIVPWERTAGPIPSPASMENVTSEFVDECIDVELDTHVNAMDEKADQAYEERIFTQWFALSPAGTTE